MALKDSFKKTGKSIGHAFSNFGKAVATTAKVAVGNEENTVNEEGKSKLRESWTNVGHGFGDAGKNIGKTAKDTVDHIDDKEKAKEAEKEKPTKPEESEVVDVDSKIKEETK